MGREDFERAVEEALAGIPDDLADLIENLAVVVEDEPSDDDLVEAGLDPEEDTLFGIYQGISLPERGAGSYGGALPDRIGIYRLPLLDYCESRRELLREIRDTVVHEVGHYFGLDEEDLPCSPAAAEACQAQLRRQCGRDGGRAGGYQPRAGHRRGDQPQGAAEVERTGSRRGVKKNRT